MAAQRDSRGRFVSGGGSGSGGGTTFDPSDHLRRMQDYQRETLDKGRVAIGRASYALLRDVMLEAPKIPHDEGTLGGSGSVHLQGKFTTSSGGFNREGEQDPNRDDVEVEEPKNIEGLVGFNSPYAAYLHEHPEFNFTDPGSGGDYMASKLITFRQDYLALIAAIMAGEI